jgi:hypothetical protein
MAMTLHLSNRGDEEDSGTIDCGRTIASLPVKLDAVVAEGQTIAIVAS